MSHGKKLLQFGPPCAQIQGIVSASGLGSLIGCSLDPTDKGLISAFVERWHRETSSFHLPVGEMTITLDDVSSLLHLPITGAFYTYEGIDSLTTVEKYIGSLRILWNWPEVSHSKEMCTVVGLGVDRVAAVHLSDVYDEMI